MRGAVRPTGWNPLATWLFYLSRSRKATRSIQHFQGYQVAVLVAVEDNAALVLVALSDRVVVVEDHGRRIALLVVGDLHLSVECRHLRAL